MSVEVKLNEFVKNRIEYISNKAKIELNNDNDRKIFVVVPDQFNFACQKLVLDNLKTNVISQIEILNFNRLVYRIYEEVNYFKDDISNIERLSLIENIITERKDELKFFGKYKITDKIIIEINNLLKLIVKNIISLDDLKSFNDKDDIILTNKIHDISLIYEEFNDRLMSLNVDYDVLTPLKEQVANCKMLDNATIYISEFYNFTNEQIEILRILDKAGVKVVILMQGNEKWYESDKTLFAPVKFILEKMNFNEANVEYLNFDTSNDRMIELKKCFMSQDCNFNGSDITINKYTSKEKELFNVCLYIRNLINKGYRFNDISVVFKKFVNYELKMKDFFNAFEIPYFVENKKMLMNAKVVRTIFKMLDMVQSNYNMEKLISFVKENNFVNFDDSMIFEFENFALKNGVEYYDTLKKCFDKLNKDEEKKKKDKFNLKYVEIVMNFIDQIEKEFEKVKKEGTTDDYYKIIIDLLLKKIDASFIDLEPKETEKLIDILEKWNKCETKTFDVTSYSDKLKILLEDVSVSIMNETLDQVSVYDSQRVNFLSTKVMILVGYNNLVSDKSKLTNLFSDKESDKLYDANIEFNKKFKNQILEEKFAFFNMMEKVTEKLMINYTMFEEDNEVEIANEFIPLTIKYENCPFVEYDDEFIIDNLLTCDEAIIKYIYLHINEYEIMKDLIKKALLKIRDKNIVEKLFDFEKNKLVCIEDKHEVLELSFSAIERYVDCPFSYFMQYKLGVKEREELQYDAATVGNIAHELFEKFFNKVASNEIVTKDLSDEKLIEEVDNILDNEIDVEFLKDEKNEVTYQRYKDILHRNMINFVSQINNGEFIVKYNELEFGKDKEVLGIEFVSDDGTQIYLGGKIDRFDTFEKDDKIYLKVIDYKTGDKSFKLSDIYKGKNMQLVIYLKVLLNKYRKEGLNPIPAGIFLSKVNKDIKIDEEFDIADNKLDGLFSNDESVLAKLDKDYKNSKILQLEYNQKGEMYQKSKDRAYSSDDFEKLTTACLEQTKKITNNICSGKMDVNISTKDDSPCSYCSYKNLCGYNEK